MVRQFKLFGTLEIVEDGVPNQVMQSPRGCALVSYLIVTREAQTREHIADLLWESTSTKQALRRLRQLLHRMRSLIPDLQVTRRTVSFKPQPDTIVDFVQLNEALASDNLAQIEEGLRLYTGELLEGFYVEGAPRLNEWLLAEQERLRHRLLAAYRQIYEAQASREAWSSAAAVAKRWLTIDELNEEAVFRLLRAQASAGQLVEARQAYALFRDTLKREVGAEPEKATAALYEEIEARLQVEERPFLASITHPRHTLPAQSTPFIGRGAELEEIARLLADPDCRLLTITAAGGMGKTRLALAAAKKHSPTFQDGAIFVPLAAIRKVDFDSSVSPLAGAIANALSFNFQGGRNPDEQLLGFLKNQEMLLLIDNFEHLLETADFLSTVLAHSPDIKIIATSRERLNLYEEWLFPLEGLSYGTTQSETEGKKARSLEEIEEYAAIQLFLQRAKQAKPSFSPIGQTNDISRIAQLVEGMPLGLELAAAWVRQLSCAAIVQEIEQGIDFLATNVRNVPKRHRSLRAVFEHTWQGLSSKEKLILQKLSMFHSGFQRGAARKVADANLRFLTAFVDKSLLTVVGADRYGIHELMRQFLAEKLAKNSEIEQQTHMLHGVTYLQLLSDLEPKLIGNDLSIGLDTVERDIDNIRAAWLWGVSQNQLHLLNDALTTLFHVCNTQGWFLEGRDLLKRTVETLQNMIQSDKVDFSYQLYRARFVGALAIFQMRLGLYEKAELNYQTSLSLFQDIVWDADLVRGRIIGAYARFLQFSGRLPQ
ncbi:MAG: BTAD domain-containing putative transcriptional regulator, partial [Chloroflexota bacterium]